MGFWYVYILQSLSDPAKHYTGFTKDLKSRLDMHNKGQVSHTSKFLPWKIQNAISFRDEAKARTFEKYLKSPGQGELLPRNTYNRYLD